jgi:hypothetical protein
MQLMKCSKSTGAAIVIAGIAFANLNFAGAATRALESIAVADAGTDAAQSSRTDPMPVQKEPTPEERMSARFPQPVRVGHLVGLPVLDSGDSTIGYVQEVVRTQDGKIQLIVPYRKHLGWAREGSVFDWGARRPVAVPIEVVAILALQIDVLEMNRADFDKAPTFSPENSKVITPDETIRIALNRR